MEITTVEIASVERLCNAISAMEVAPLEEKLPEMANAKIAMAREMLCEVANLDIAILRKMLCDRVHVMNTAMASVSCGLGHLNKTYRNVARVEAVYCSVARIAIVLSVAAVVVMSFGVFGHEVARCYAHVSRILESATSDVHSLVFVVANVIV